MSWCIVIISLFIYATLVQITSTFRVYFQHPRHTFYYNAQSVRFPFPLAIFLFEPAVCVLRAGHRTTRCPSEAVEFQHDGDPMGWTRDSEWTNHSKIYNYSGIEILVLDFVYESFVFRFAPNPEIGQQRTGYHVFVIQGPNSFFPSRVCVSKPKPLLSVPTIFLNFDLYVYLCANLKSFLYLTNFDILKYIKQKISRISRVRF